MISERQLSHCNEQEGTWIGPRLQGQRSSKAKQRGTNVRNVTFDLNPAWPDRSFTVRTKPAALHQSLETRWKLIGQLKIEHLYWFIPIIRKILNIRCNNACKGGQQESSLTPPGGRLQYDSMLHVSRWDLELGLYWHEKEVMIDKPRSACDWGGRDIDAEGCGRKWFLYW